jgi:hypothetical protein
LTLSDQWQQAQATVTMPASTGTLRAQIYMPANVNIDFDGGVLTDDLLTDGGFERGGQGWGLLPASGGTMNIANYSNASAHDGGSYEESNSSLPNGSIYQDVGVNMAAGQSATFSMWVRLGPGVTPSGQSVSLCLWALSAGNVNACQNLTLSDQWQQAQATVTMPASTGTLRAQIYMPANVNIDFDGGSLGAPQTADAVYVPTNEALPAVTGAVVIGATLSCSNGAWANTPTEFAYSWLDNGQSVANADAATYTVTAADQGHDLQCAVTASNAAAGSTTATSAALSVPAPPVNTSPGNTSPGASSASAPRCVVPNLKHMTLAEARTALARANCQLGKTHEPSHGRRRRVLRVTAQSAKHGSRHPNGYGVNLTLRALRRAG